MHLTIKFFLYRRFKCIVLNSSETILPRGTSVDTVDIKVLTPQAVAYVGLDLEVQTLEILRASHP